MAPPYRGDPRSSARDLLDELMGQERDLDLKAKAKKKFYESDVCKFYLVGLSPYHVLKNTRGYTLGGMDAWVRHAYATALNVPTSFDVASLRCDVNLKKQYESLPEKEKRNFGYDKLLFDCLGSLMRAMDRRIAANQEKCLAVDVDGSLVARMGELDAMYKSKIEESEKLGEVGEIEESMKLMAQAEAIKSQKTHLEDQALKPNDVNLKRFVVCQTTGDLIESAAANDDAWMASHFESDDFQGWKQLREWYDRLSKQRDGKGPPRGIPGYRGDDDERVALAGNDDDEDLDKDEKDKDDKDHQKGKKRKDDDNTKDEKTRTNGHHRKKDKDKEDGAADDHAERRKRREPSSGGDDDEKHLDDDRHRRRSRDRRRDPERHRDRSRRRDHRDPDTRENRDDYYDRRRRDRDRDRSSRRDDGDRYYRRRDKDDYYDDRRSRRSRSRDRHHRDRHRDRRRSRDHDAESEGEA
mmetsp:Transcript_23996/g.77202  ORF Transcript_23996/g.77202 Transcript_23996/m.77202 type:complete len:467 (-) Transcript_23996:654-2054(-)